MHDETARHGAEPPATDRSRLFNPSFSSPSLDPKRPGPEGAAGDGQPDDEARHLGVLVRRLSALASLSDAEAGLLRELAADARYHPPGRSLYVAGVPSPPRMVVAGWACWHRVLPGGARQIVSLRLPGDLLWPVPPPGLRPPCSVAALTELETVSAQPLAEAMATADPAHPGLGRAGRLMAHLDEALLCDQVVRLGRQTAGRRFAHLMLELRERLARVDLAGDDRFAMPLTQDVLADALGLSVVHVNRTVQQLRHDGLLDVRGGVVTLLDPERLRDLAGWTAPPALAVQ